MACLGRLRWLLALSAAASALEACAADAFRAAMAQVSPVDDGADAAETLAASFKIYSRIVRDAALDQAQIVVFPEWGLFGKSGVSSRDHVREFCEPVKDSAIVRTLASYAAQHKVIVVANVCDKQPCGSEGDCAFADGERLYNTEVAIDERGELLAVYHKHHVWKTGVFDVPPLEVVTFEASFGVTFGLMVCYDILWPSPSRDLLEAGATHFPYSVAIPTSFASRLVFSAWSWHRGATLLASNLGSMLGNVGSGAFASGARLSGPSSTVGANYVLADVPM